LLIVSTGSLVLKREVLQKAIINYVSNADNEAIINSLNILFQQLPNTSSLSVGLILSFLLFFWSSGNIFLQLKNTIDKMWNITHEKRKHFHYSIKKRLLSSATVFVFGAVIIIINVFELLFLGISKKIVDTVLIPVDITQFLTLIINFFILIVLFMYLYRILPEANLALHSVFAGSFLTAVFLTTWKYIFALYLRYNSMTTVYGSIGSFMGFFLWIYISATIVTIMIEFTKIYADVQTRKKV